jgi:hypothetical protein
MGKDQNEGKLSVSADQALARLLSGLVHSVADPHHARLSKDVMFSLRYCNDEHITN